MAIQASAISASSKRKSRKIPANLIRETLRGQPLYYKGYKEVLTGKRQLEEIMGSSSLQAIIIGILDFFIQSHINRKIFWIATNEAGLHLGQKNNLSTDLGIFLKEKVTLDEHYFNVAPEVAIEVDVKIETEKELDYIFDKSEELKAFGTKKIIWIITKRKKTFVFTAGHDTVIHDWDKDLAIIDDEGGVPIFVNLHRLLKEEGVVY
jgi:hypothetical protein